MRGGLTPSHQNFIKYETLQESDNLARLYISRLILTVLQKDLQLIISLLNILVEYCPEKCIAYMKNIGNVHDYDYFRARGAYRF